MDFELVRQLALEVFKELLQIPGITKLENRRYNRMDHIGRFQHAEHWYSIWAVNASGMPGIQLHKDYSSFNKYLFEFWVDNLSDPNCIAKVAEQIHSYCCEYDYSRPNN